MIESTQTKDALRAKVHETRDNVSEAAHLAKEVVQDKLHDFADRVSEKYQAGRGRLHAMEDSFVGSVKESPFKALMIAAGVGLLLGFLVRRS